VSVDPTGVANFTSTQLPVGSNSIIATYNGDANYASSVSGAAAVAINKAASSTYTNPLTLNLTESLHGVSCADPAIYKDQQGGVNTWYLYCTSDALYAGDPNPHYLAIYQSSDLVNWTYDDNAFSGLPSWANVSGASLWAPAIKYFNGQYYLYYAASATSLAGNGSAIGVGTSSSPAGPFVDSGSPVVEPEVATNCCNGAYRSTIDPDEIQDASGQRYILFGSFTGGIYVRKLSADGLTSDKSSEQQIAADNRYEGGNWWYDNGYYYLFASSTNCCNGPLSGYGVFVGRSTTPMGPYDDAQGISMTATNVGGTPVLRMNGNSVIGPGGNVIFADESGQNYILYHGIVSTSPYYSGDVGYTARPGYIDAIDWVNGWPVARGGFGPSDQDAPQPLPVAQPGGTSGYVTTLAAQDAERTAISALSDEFNSTSMSSQWSFVHSQPSYTLTGTAYQVPTVGFDTTNAMASVPMLAESAPDGDYMVETKLDITLPISGNGNDYAQAGLLLYEDDSDYVRLDLYSNNDTRQVEFIKAETEQATGYPTWGATNLGAPAMTTDVNAWLRIVKRNVNGQEHYTAYSSNDGVNWIQSGTWVHQLGSAAKICLYAGNRTGYTVSFDYVHVSTLQ
jgi:arabinan endo-1,5-alpha-L-arabinosidase